MSVSKTFWYLGFLTLINLVLICFILSVLADNLIGYRAGFYLTLPIIMTCTFLIGLVAYKHSHASSLNSSQATFALMLMITNTVFLIINYYCWIDLFDGTTNAVMP